MKKLHLFTGIVCAFLSFAFLQDCMVKQISIVDISIYEPIAFKYTLAVLLSALYLSLSKGD